MSKNKQTVVFEEHFNTFPTSDSQSATCSQSTWRILFHLFYLYFNQSDQYCYSHWSGKLVCFAFKIVFDVIKILKAVQNVNIINSSSM